jgi:hypothetical protein
MHRFLVIFFVFVAGKCFGQFYVSERMEQYVIYVADIIESHKGQQVTFSLCRNDSVLEKFTARLNDSNTVTFRWINIPYENAGAKAAYDFFRGIYYQSKNVKIGDADEFQIRDGAVLLKEFENKKLVRSSEIILDSLDRIVKNTVTYNESEKNSRKEVFTNTYSRPAPGMEVRKYKHDRIINGKIQTVQTITTVTTTVYDSKNNREELHYKSTMESPGLPELGISGLKTVASGKIIKTLNAGKEPVKIELFDNDRTDSLNLRISYEQN